MFLESQGRGAFKVAQGAITAAGWHSEHISLAFEDYSAGGENKLTWKTGLRQTLQ